MDQIVIFTLDELKYALALSSVIRVIHAVEIRNLPKAPAIVAGIINVNGQIIPVINVRTRFGFTSREMELDDQLIMADTGKRQVALWVDTVSGIQNIQAHQHVNTTETLPYAQFINGVLKVEDDLILIYDLEQFLDLEEESQLEEALSMKKST